MYKAVAFVSTFLLFMLVVGIVSYVRGWATPGTFGRPGLDAPAVVREVRQAHDLVTVRYIVEKAVGLQEPRSPLGSESILLLVQGKVLAGVDLSQFNQLDVTIHTPQSVDVTIPEAKIFETFLDEKQTRIWDRRITWWTPWVAPDPELEHKARLAALEEIRKGALASGILEEARHNAQTSITNLLHAAGVREVHVNVQKAT